MGAYTNHIPCESAGMQFTLCLIRGQNLRHVQHQSAAPLTTDPLTAGSRRGGTPVQSARLPGDLPYLCLQDFTTTLCNSTNGIGESGAASASLRMCALMPGRETPQRYPRDAPAALLQSHLAFSIQDSRLPFTSAEDLMLCLRQAFYFEP